jgi:hypothetical protein
VRTTETSSSHLVDLASHYNNVGTSPAGATEGGRFNVWGNSFSAEHLPEPGSAVVIDGVPFIMPALGSGRPDNVRCDGQLLDVTPARYDWLYLLASSERRAEDEVALHFADGSVDFEPLRLSDFWAAPPIFGETKAFESSSMHYPHHVQFDVSAMMWCQRVAIVRRAPLAHIRLPHNIAMHIFAATLIAPPVDGELR